MRWVGYLAIGLVLMSVGDTGTAATPPPDVSAWGLDEQADGRAAPLGQPDAHDCADLARQLLCMLGVGH